MLEPGTRVPIHRHEDTSETIICLSGRLDVVFYEELPQMDAGGPVHDGKTVLAESEFKEFLRTEICPREGALRHSDSSRRLAYRRSQRAECHLRGEGRCL